MDTFCDYPWLLEILKIGLFLAAFLIATNYMLPKGTLYFLEWKKTGQGRLLSAGFSFICAGTMMLIYLVYRMIFSY